MSYHALLADLILVLHFAIVIFVVGGQALILAGWARSWQWVRNFHFRLVHLITIGYITVQAWLGELCPLTVWEQQLRARAGQPVYEQSFIEYWVSRALLSTCPGGCSWPRTRRLPGLSC